MQRFIPILFIWATAVVSSPAVDAFDSRQYIERAVALIEAGNHDLARTYLEPALIDFRLNRGERSRAYYLRGYSFFAQGMYVSANKDYGRALEFHPGNPIVLTALAQMQLAGRGVEANPELGVAFLEQAVAVEHAPAKLHLGIAYVHGAGVEQDVEAARRWLREAAEDELPEAMIHLAQTYRTPIAETPDPEQAEAWYRKAHEAGAEDAMAYLGYMAEAGEGQEPDPDAARAYFREAADAGSALAQAKLGHIYLTGTGVEADPDRARRLFHAAADQDHPTGFMGLAYLYETGTAVDRDAERAVAWYRRAAEAGVVDAQLRMAHRSLRQGDAAGHREAAEWLARAAAQNNLQALNDYAWLLATSHHDGVRNGPQALTLAMQAVSRERNPSYLDTLAAAYAETGKFERAVAAQQEALALAGDDREELVAELEAHLAAFEAGRPWRE